MHQFRVEEPPGDHIGDVEVISDPKIVRTALKERSERRSGARSTRSARITSPARLTIKLHPGSRQLINSTTSAIGPATKMNPSPWIWRAMMGLTGRAEAAEANDESNGKNSKTDKCEIDHYELHQSKEEYDEDEHELHQSKESSNEDAHEMYPSKEKYDADHNPVLVGTCERIRNNNAPTGWRTPAAG